MILLNTRFVQLIQVNTVFAHFPCFHTRRISALKCVILAGKANPLHPSSHRLLFAL
ncbi:hypothetical protein KIN20_035797 [Parelaphostrongylus tenuis]|uniref:Uncharacterized protein n=1 Tax=Parelaphostrongylus tenuis TaxID=148309 RepID=A0AAD5RBQ2_PARTN|nr:hypothetical protein KIN20_035797 [Parelaphostrongylus tenuis]